MMILYIGKTMRCLSQRTGCGLNGFLLLVTFTIILAQESAKNLQCENEWHLISGQCYRYFSASQTWYQANSSCNSYSSILAEPLGYNLNGRLGNIISGLNRNNASAWIGYTYLNALKSVANINEAFWSDGSESSVAYGLWEDDQPSLEQGKCGSLKYSDKHKQWKWSLNHCNKTKAFVCQMQACPIESFNCGQRGQHIGRCLDRSKICDGRTDCENGLDEFNCPENCHFLLNQSEGEIKETNIIQRLSKSLSCQWIIEGKIDSKLQIWFESTAILQDQAVLEVWVGARSISESYLAAILREPRNPDEYILSYNNFAIIRLQVQSTENLKPFQIKWLSGLKCSWIPFPHRVHLETEPILSEQSNLSKCLETCGKLENCSVITVNHAKGLCELYPLVPLSVESSCCDSYVKSCPETAGQNGSSDLLSHNMVLTATEEYQSVYSPLYPKTAPGNMVKTWLLKAPLWDVITLQFQDLMLSNEDELIVYNGDSSISEVLVTITNASYQYLTPIISTTNTLYVKYKTGIFPHKNQGFLARFKKGCGFKVDSNFGYVSSPGYGTAFSYPSKIVCEWEIVAKPPSKYIKLEFTPKFGLENDKDFLEVYNGTISDENKLHQGEGFTGTTVPPILTTNSGKFILRLKTSITTAGVGFNATFSKDIYCGPVPTLNGGRWINSTGFYNKNYATFECFENFEAKPGNTVYCSKSGHWEPQSECSVKTCPTLQPVLGGQWERNLTISGTSVYQLVCETPIYQISGDSIIFCWNGNWTGNPTCCRQKCNLKMFANVTHRSNITGYMMGESVNITCLQGYQLVGKNPFLCGIDPIPSCQNIDECSTNQTVCPYQCIDEIGSYTCKCDPGYQSNDPTNEGKNCSDINECLIQNGGCQHVCINTNGSYHCSCNEGWELFVTNGQQRMWLHPNDTGLDPADPLRYNYSCVRVVCETPQFANGTILSLHNDFYFDDSVKVVCSQGYELVGNSTITCQRNGNWTSLPTCKEAKCPPVETNTSTFKGTVYPEGLTKYGEIINITCNQNAQKVYQRKCLYDLKNKIFTTLGETSECLAIDCGQPKQIPGMVVPDPFNCTHYGCSFEFQCLQPLFKAVGVSSMQNQTVVCGKNSRWTFNTLTCIGPSCSDPGRPPDGKQNFTSYEIGKLVKYICSRPGYKPKPPYPLKCVVVNDRVQWNDTIPTCIDTEKPTFINCPPKILRVEKMSRLNRKAPTAQDNSKYLKSVTVSPVFFSINQTIFDNTSVRYLAEDHAGNSAECTFKIVVIDHEAPKLECPEDLEYTLEKYTVLKKENFSVTATDNSKSVNLAFEPEELHLKYNKFSSIYGMRVTATDPSNNTASCYIFIKVKFNSSEICRTENIANAELVCLNITDGINCTMSCKQNYAFYHNVDAVSEVISCNFTNGWNRDPPVCVEKISSTYQFAVKYKYKTENITCIQKELMEEVFKEYKILVTGLQALYSKDINIVKPSSYLLPVSTELKNKSVYATIRFEYSGNPTYLSTIKNEFDSRYLISDGGSSFETSCTPTKECVESREGFKCSGNAKLVQISTCLTCPPGTYGFDFEECLPCPQDTYNSQYGSNKCIACPLGLYNSRNGSSSIQDCFDTCPKGTVSATGHRPCTLCPRNTYVNRTICQPCPPGKYTLFNGTTNSTHCLNECSPGYFSETGYEPCQQCPENTYTKFHHRTMCTPCNQDESSLPGSTSMSKCSKIDICVKNPCEHGTCSVVKHYYRCDCNQGYTGENCSIVLDPCTSDPCYHNGTCQPTKDGKYNCLCEPDFTGDNCENNVNHCKEDSCKNNGTCQNLYNTFKCVCPSWSHFTGDFCNETTSPCSLSPCHNNGTCILEGSKDFYCECPSGYSGELCNIDIDECQSNPCLNNGSCTDLPDMFDCTCQPGFSGIFCELLDDPCSLLNCTNNSKCIPDFTDFTDRAMCVCFINFHKDNNGLCVPVNSCKTGTCQNGGTCIETNGTVSCQCHPGYEGSLCQYKSKVCSHLVCENGTICQEEKGMYQCVYDSNQTKAEENRTCNSSSCPQSVCSFNVTNNCTDFDPRDPNCLANGIVGVYCKEDNCQENGTCPCLPTFIRECDSNPCSNGSTCLQSGNFSRCICLPGYYGSSCQQMIDTCQTANHCIGSKSSCEMVSNKATCNCPTGFGGVGCQDKSLCSPTSCQNNGVCLERSNNITCICPLEFTGERCEDVTNPCSKKSCPGQTCQVKNHQATCMCPENKWKSQCLTDIPYRSDLEFRKFKGYFVAMNAPDFSLTRQDQLTMTFWIKYSRENRNNEKLTSATSVCLYVSKDLINPMPSAKQLVHLHGNILSIQMFGEIFSVTLNSITNGTWHHVILQWSNRIGTLLVYHNGNLSLEKTLGDGKMILPLSLLVVGGKLNTEQNIIEPSSFSGRISHLWILNQTLSKEELQNYWKVTNQTLSNIFSNLVKNMLLLPNYLLDFQSEVKPDMCEIKRNCAKTNKLSSPTVITCPSDQLYISKSWAALKWTKPEFKDVDRIVSNYEPEVSKFDWGDYTVNYIGYDQYNSSAVCTFRLFNHQFACKKPDDPFGGTQHCWKEKDSLLCKPKCNDASYKFSISGPSIYACGPYHMWGKRDQLVSFKYPPCAAASKSLKNITLEFSIEFDPIYDNSKFLDLCQLIKGKLKAVVEKRSDASCPTGECKLGVVINGKACSLDSQNILRKKRSTSNTNVANVQTGVNGIVLNPSQNQNTSLLEDMIAAIFDDQTFKEKLAAMNASLVSSSLKSQEISYCNGGDLQGSSCVEAGPGTFWSSEYNSIIPCPKGTYQPASKSTSCNKCPSGKTTETILAVQESECKDICLKGSYFQLSTSKCTLCSVGFYQDQPGMFLCKACKEGNTTNGEGSTSESDCVKFAKNDDTVSAGLNTTAIIIIVVIITILLLVIICLVFFRKQLKKCCCRKKTQRISPTVITATGKSPSRYGNIKMVSYNLTELRERRLANQRELLHELKNSPNPRATHDIVNNNATYAYNSEIIVLPAKIYNAPTKPVEDYSPRIYDEQTSPTHNGYYMNIQPKLKETERKVPLIHLANYHANNQKIMVDSDEEDMR